MWSTPSSPPHRRSFIRLMMQPTDIAIIRLIRNIHEIAFLFSVSVSLVSLVSRRSAVDLLI